MYRVTKNPVSRPTEQSIGQHRTPNKLHSYRFSDLRVLNLSFGGNLESIMLEP
jgi:hypothetical protein